MKFIAWSYDATGHPLRSYEGTTPSEALRAAHLGEATHIQLWHHVSAEQRKSAHDPIVRMNERGELLHQLATLRALLAGLKGMPGALSLRARLEAVLDELAELEAREAHWLEMGGC
jgi:hypothetical protein